MLKKLLITLLVLVLFVTIFFIFNLRQTGFFREIEPIEFGTVHARLPLPGAEDLAISHPDKFLIVSSDDRRATWNGKPGAGGLYYIDLTDQSFTPMLLEPGLPDFHPHGISLLKLDSTRYGVYVVNHNQSGHFIEVFELINKKLKHIQTITDPAIISPNDVVAVADGKFYMTNDHGYSTKLGVFFENYAGIKASNVMFYDGENFRKVAEGIAYANGVNYDIRTRRLYVASPRKFLIKEYQAQANGDLDFLRDIPTGTGVDNLEWDADSLLWSGAHPNLMHFTQYAKLKKDISPSEVVVLDVREGKPAVRSVYVNSGEIVSGSSAAVRYCDYLFVGNVMDKELVILKKWKITHCIAMPENGK
jgi:arylesterase / paraoxonase